MSTQKVSIPSTKLEFDAVLIGLPDSEKIITATLCIRRKPISMDKLVELQGLIYDHPKVRKYLTHAELDENFGADKDDVAKLKEYLDKNNVTITKSNSLTRTLEIKGSIVGFESAFDVQMNIYEIIGKSQFVAYKGMLSIPQDLSEIVMHVNGLVYQVKKEYRRPHKNLSEKSKAKPLKQVGYTPVEIAKAYEFPTRTKGLGQTMAIVELSGKYKESDFKQFFRKLRIKEPVIKIVGNSDNPSGIMSNAEVTLDTEVVGAIIPRAKIVIYYAHDVIDAMKAIINDTKNCPDVVSISWAGNEKAYNKYDLTELSNLFYEASLIGITVVAASGDHGAYNGAKSPNVQLPSTNPFVLACGGTNLVLKDGHIESEEAWNEYKGAVASGGGYSTLFPMPPYQAEAIGKYPYQKMNARAVPDVSANASMAFGYASIFDGKEVVIGGTSAATPLWASLIVQMNIKLGYKLGFVNKLFYQLAGTESFRQITQGNNNLYNATEYWSPCCGLGSPNGNKLIEMIKNLEPKK